MRYYRIEVGNDVWDSCPGGVNDPGAQQVELMLEIFVTAAEPSSNSTVEIHGVGWDQVATANKYIGQTITVYGGMSHKGLPLSVYQSRYQGKLITGRVQKVWGNWVGTNMSIGFQVIVAAADSGDPSGGGGGGVDPFSLGVGQSGPSKFNRTGARSIDRRPFARGVTPTSFLPTIANAIAGGGVGGSPVSNQVVNNIIGGIIPNFTGGGTPGLTNPLNLIHNLMPNMPLSSAVMETLSKALPGAPTRVALNPALMLAYQDAGMYQNVSQYMGYINKLSQSILGATKSNSPLTNYLGAHFSSDGDTNDVWDGTRAFGSTDVTVGDLIGQPTWVGRYEIQVKVVMRGQIKVAMYLTLPATLYSISPDAVIPGMGSNQVSNDTISGTIMITGVRHIGDFRNPDGNSWCTIITGYPVNMLTPGSPQVPIIVNNLPPPLIPPPDQPPAP